MNMDEDFLNSGAILFELGMPMVIGAICLVLPKYRQYLLPVLGSVSLAVLGYLYILFGYFVINREEYEYAYSAVWVMSFFVYLIMFVVGIFLSLFLRSKFSNITRYILGLTAGGLTVASFMVIQ